MVLVGEVVFNFDGNGRFTLPVRFRRYLPDDLVIFKVPDVDYPHLWLSTEEVFSAWIESVLMSRLDSGVRSQNPGFFNSTLYGEAEYLSIDSQGRAHISANLREHARLSNSALILGVDDHLEIWDPEVYKQVKEKILSSHILDELL